MDTIGQDRLSHPPEPADVRFPEIRERAHWLGGDLQSVRNFLCRPMIKLESWPSKRIMSVFAIAAAALGKTARSRPSSSGCLLWHRSPNVAAPPIRLGGHGLEW
jgi:hypothetical protein